MTGGNILKPKTKITAVIPEPEPLPQMVEVDIEEAKGKRKKKRPGRAKNIIAARMLGQRRDVLDTRTGKTKLGE